MQWNGNDHTACEGLAFQTLFQNIAEWICQRYAVGILEVMNDFAERGREEQSRPGEIKNMFAFQAQSTHSFDRRRRLTAFGAEGRVERNQAGPAFRTCPSPPALLNLSVTLDTCDWEQEIEYVVEQSAFGETQRAGSV